MFFGLGRKPKYPEKNSKAQGETPRHKLHTCMGEIKPLTLEVFGKHANTKKLTHWRCLGPSVVALNTPGHNIAPPLFLTGWMVVVL